MDLPKNFSTRVKSDLKAHKIKTLGSECLQTEQYSQALFYYNLALTLAETNNQKSLIFANRSLVYLKLEKYEHSLRNIQLARDYGYSVEKLPKLKEREETCRKALKSQDPEDDPCKFFRISLPPNPKIPFIAHCLEIRKDPKFGRGIYTNKDLEPGDVIAVEQTFLAYQPDKRVNITRCRNCFASNNMDLRPCSGICSNVMFCSKKCEKAASGWHKHETMDATTDEDFSVPWARELFLRALSFAGGDIKKLHQIVHSRVQFSVFDFDFSDPNDPQRNFKLLQAFCGLHVTKSSFETFIPIYNTVMDALNDPSITFLPRNRTDCRNMIDFLCLILLVANSCHYPFEQMLLDSHERVKTRAIGFFPFFSLINHSCNPNALHISVDNKLAIVVLQSIPAGSQIFVGYKHHSHFTVPKVHDRRQDLMKCFEFMCDCTACKIPEIFFPYQARPSKEATKVAPTPNQIVAVIKKQFNVLETLRNRLPSKMVFSLFFLYYQLQALASFSMLRIVDLDTSIYGEKINEIYAKINPGVSEDQK